MNPTSATRCRHHSGADAPNEDVLTSFSCGHYGRFCYGALRAILAAQAIGAWDPICEVSDTFLRILASFCMNTGMSQKKKSGDMTFVTPLK